MIFFLNLDWPNLQDSAMRIISKYNSIQAQNDMVEDIDAVDLFFFCIHSRLVSVSLLFSSWRVCSISATTRPVSLRVRGLITHLALWPIGYASFDIYSSPELYPTHHVDRTRRNETWPYVIALTVLAVFLKMSGVVRSPIRLLRLIGRRSHLTKTRWQFDDTLTRIHVVHFQKRYAVKLASLYIIVMLGWLVLSWVLGTPLYHC